MRSKQVFIQPAAEADIEQAYDWYQQQRDGLGDDFNLCLDATLEAIAQRPQSFPKAFRRYRRAVVRRFPYLVFFVDTRRAVIVFGVFHGKRHPSAWLERLD